MSKIITLSILAILLIAGLSGWYLLSQSSQEILIPEITEPTLETTKQPEPQATTTAEQINTSKVKLESKELGINFDFLAPPGNISYEFNEWPEEGEPSGSLYSWKLKRSDTGYTYSFVGGASQDMGIGRERWVTDNYRWLNKDGIYIVEQSKGYKFEITPLKIITRTDGLEGLIFDPNQSFFKEVSINPQKLDRAAILNFPENYHSKLKSITFYFYDETPIDDIEKVLMSVKFEK